MPLHWTIDSRARLMTAVAEGSVTKAEVVAYLDVMAASGAGRYRRLFDGSRGEPAMGPEDIMELAVRMRAMQQSSAPGPLAVVMPPPNAKFMRIRTFCERLLMLKNGCKRNVADPDANELQLRSFRKCQAVSHCSARILREKASKFCPNTLLRRLCLLCFWTKRAWVFPAPFEKNLTR